MIKSEQNIINLRKFNKYIPQVMTDNIFRLGSDRMTSGFFTF